MCRFIVLKLILLSTSFSWAAKPLGNPDAPNTGTFYIQFSTAPTTLNPFSGATDYYSSQATAHVFDSLMTRNIDTYEWEPALADKIEVSPDGLTFTLRLREGATFSDGKPVTVEDVVFTYKAIMDPRYKANDIRPYYENFETVEAIEGNKVRFKAKKKYFQNLTRAAGFPVYPKHIYGDPEAKMNKKAIGSGPYIIEKYDEGKSIIYKRNENWWGLKVKEYAGFAKPERIHIRIIKDENATFETLKKGELDYTRLSPEQFELNAQGEIWGKKVFKKQVENSASKSTPFIGWNLSNDLFKDKNVRVALAMLYDRGLLAEKFFFGKAMPATGPWYQQHPDADPSRKPIPFDPKKAQKMLSAAGWADNDKNGILEKEIGGKKREFKFTLLNPNPNYERYFTVYKEELKKAGIDMSITNLEWNAFGKKLDDKDFEAIYLAWTGTIEYDPKQIWHSTSSDKGGSNFISYNNPEVDKLIDQGREEMDSKKRSKIFRKVFSLIAEDAPYVFLINMKYGFYGHSSRVGMAVPTYKYDVGTDYWWIKKDM